MSGAVGEAHAVVQRRGVGQLLAAAAQQLQVGDEVLAARQDVAHLARVEDLPVDGQGLQRRPKGLVVPRARGRLAGVGGQGQQGQGQCVVQWEHASVLRAVGAEPPRKHAVRTARTTG